MRGYYNEHDAKAVAWLEWLIDYRQLPAGRVDGRDIQDVRGEDVRDFQTCHFFAGIGGWPYALELAGWPANQPVWTASLPCQPFSQAGQQRGTDDERHLWPVFRDLVEECRPPTIFGEQVASKAGRAWLAAVQDDLEALGYSTAAADLCAAGVGAPHIRQRLYWAAHLSGERLEGTSELPDQGAKNVVAGRGGCDVGVGDTRLPEPPGRQPETHPGTGEEGRNRAWGEPTSHGGDGGVGISDRARRESRRTPAETVGYGRTVEPTGGVGGLPDPSSARRHVAGGAEIPFREWEADDFTRAEQNDWGSAIYVHCADGKARPIKPGLQPLVDGLPGRVGLLRGYGNAIVPQVAQAFIESVMGVGE